MFDLNLPYYRTGFGIVLLAWLHGHPATSKFMQSPGQMWHILTLNDSYRKFTCSKECTCCGRLAIPLRSHHGSKRLLTRVSSFWASGGHRSGSASGSWTRLCYFTGIVTCDPQAQWCTEVCSGPLQEEAAWSIPKSAGVDGKDAACLRLDYYWMQVASLSRNVDVLAFFLHLFTRHTVTHAIFNLPAMGVELLDCFRGLDYVKQNLPRPLVPRSAFSSCTVRQSHEVIWVISN